MSFNLLILISLSKQVLGSLTIRSFSSDLSVPPSGPYGQFSSVSPILIAPPILITSRTLPNFDLSLVMTSFLLTLQLVYSSFLKRSGTLYYRTKERGEDEHGFFKSNDFSF